MGENWIRILIMFKYRLKRMQLEELNSWAVCVFEYGLTLWPAMRMQVFNEINSRKLGDSSLNVFKGITKSRAFMYVVIITVTLQIIIVSTPLATVFITVRQNFWEWLFALLVGAGGLVVSAMTKLITQHMQNSSSGVGHQHHEELDAMRNSI